MPPPRPEASRSSAGGGPSPAAVRRSTHAPLLEVFTSIQGEGLFVGQPQDFLRLAGCPLRCDWCDTRGSWGLPPRAPSADESVSGADLRTAAWITPLDAAARVQRLAGELHDRRRPLSITGGEPLIWPDFIAALLPLLGERPVHLETAGAHPAALATLVDRLAHVSLDLKLPADLAPPITTELGTGPEAPPADAESWSAARLACLELLAGRPACAKLPVAAGRQAADFEELLLDLEASAPQLPLFIQPVNGIGGNGERLRGPRPELLMELAERGEELGLTVRVVPQIHPVIGLD